MPVIDTESFLSKINLVKNEKTKTLNLYNNLLKAKNTKGADMHKENKENFSKKEETKYFDMLDKNIEIFLKISNILRRYKKYFLKIC